MDEGTPQTEAAFWLALIRAPACAGPAMSAWLATAASPEPLFDLSRSELCSLGFSQSLVDYLRRPDWSRVESDLRWLERTGDQLVPLSSCRYPPLLKQICDPPPALMVRGDPRLLAGVQLAIVGSRNPTADGRRNARYLAHGAAEAGLTVTSGMATGIDSCAHYGALEAARPTIAVLGNGLDITYPRKNRALAEKIAANGALVSEFPLGYSPLPANFPRRNRIISGLSVGVLVVEAAIRSGSLTSARHAADQGRDVFAVPSNIANPLARGCHALIRDGAKLVERIEDILEETGALSACSVAAPEPPRAEPGRSEGLDESSKLLLDNIGFQPANVDFLVEITGMPANVVIPALSSLEISGYIEALPGKNYVRRPLTGPS